MHHRIAAGGEDPVLLRLRELPHPSLGDPHVRIEGTRAVESRQHRKPDRIDRGSWARRPGVQGAVSCAVTAHGHADSDARVDVVRHARSSREVIDPVLRRLFAQNARSLLEWVGGGNQIIRLQASRDTIDVL